MTRPLRIPLRLLALLLAAAALLLAAPVAHGAVPRDFVGMTSEDAFAGNSGYRASQLGRQAGVGVGLHRQVFRWREIERTRGRYSLGYFDDYVASAAAHGIRVLPILFDPPRFHARRGGGRATCPPRSNRTMARFARVLVRRYGPRGSLWRERPGVRRLPIRSWQIWNEPNLGVYWCGRANARAYVAMLRTVGRAIRRADRRAEIVTAGLPPSKLRDAVELSRYIRAMYRSGARRSFRTMAINSYAKDHRELARLLRSVRRLMNRAGHRRARIWITELGWSDRGPRHRFVVGAAGQANRIGRSVAVIARQRKRLGLRGFVYYTWRDAAPYPPLYRDMWGLHTGLLTLEGHPKAAFHAFSGAVARLR